MTTKCVANRPPSEPRKQHDSPNERRCPIGGVHIDPDGIAFSIVFSSEGNAQRCTQNKNVKVLTIAKTQQNPHRTGRLELQRLGGSRLSAARLEVRSPRLSRVVFRHDRDQLAVLSHPSADAREELGAPRRRRIADFKFTTKVFRGFTHEKAELAEADVKAFRNYLDPLMEADRLGAILCSFRGASRTRRSRARSSSALFDAFEDYPKALEVRHSTFQNDGVLRAFSTSTTWPG